MLLTATHPGATSSLLLLIFDGIDRSSRETAFLLDQALSWFYLEKLGS